MVDEEAAAGQVGAGWGVIEQSGVRKRNSIRRSDVAYYMRVVLGDVKCACAESGGWVSEVFGLACESSLLSITHHTTASIALTSTDRRQQGGFGCKFRKQRTRACKAHT